MRHALQRDSPGDDGFDPDRLDGRDPALIGAILPALRFVNGKYYFRLQVDGIENIRRDSTLSVANHNGGIAGPDLCDTLGTLWSVLGPDAPLYALAHDFAMRQFTPFGRLLQRLGGVRATQKNALTVYLERMPRLRNAMRHSSSARAARARLPQTAPTRSRS